MDQINGENFYNVEGTNGMVTRSTDPVILPQPYVTPSDFAAQYPTPLNTNEIIAMCEKSLCGGLCPLRIRC